MIKMIYDDKMIVNIRQCVLYTYLANEGLGHGGHQNHHSPTMNPTSPRNGHPLKWYRDLFNLICVK